MKIKLLPDTFAITKLEPNILIPDWATKSPFFSVTKTGEELSIVCEQSFTPEGLISEKDWKVFGVIGPLDFSLTGILSQLAHPLAEAEISIFAISTFDTDYILVKSDKVESVTKIWESHGHEIIS